MNTIYRCAFPAASRLAAIVLGACLIAPASAEPKRAFPPETLRGTMVFGDYPQVSLNGQATQLSPGSRIRSQNNRIVMAASLAGSRQLVHYTLGIGGTQLQDVWILRPEEAAVRPWPTTLEQAHNWRFDPNSQTWARP